MNKDKKRQRSENWLDEDKSLLKELVKERVHILENKNTDTNTNVKKTATWSDLLNSFSSMCKGRPRTLSQLKFQWAIYKMVAKKKKSTERMQLLKTDGGPATMIEPSTSDDISVWLPNEFIIDSNEFDSDHTQILVIPDPSPSLSGKCPDEDTIVVDVSVQEKEKEITKPQKKKMTKMTRLMQPSHSAVTAAAAADISRTEMECRRELHKLQMEVGG